MDSNWLQITAAQLRKLGHKRHSRLGDDRGKHSHVDGFETLEDRMMLSTLVAGPNVNVSQLLGNQDESAIVVNPSNPDELFAFSNNAVSGMFAAYSTDGGTTWLPSNGPNFVIADGNDNLIEACCDPTAAWDEFGNLFISYLDATISSNPVALSTDGGATFTPLTTLGASPDQPTIVTGPGEGGVGRSVWVTWNEAGRIVASGATVTGLGIVGAFSAPVNVPGMTSFSFGDIAIGPDGQVVVTAQNNDGDEGPDTIRVSTDPDGLGPLPFGPFVTATTTNVGDFDAIPAQDRRTVDSESGLVYDRSGGAFDGRLYLVYTEEVVDEGDDLDIMVRTSDDDGATWSAPVRVNDDTTDRSQFLPKIALDQTTGVVGVVWYDARQSFLTNTRIELYGSVSDDGGATWSANTLISDGVTNATVAATGGQQLGDYIGLTFNEGIMHPSWADNSNSTGDNPNGTGAELDIYTATVTVLPAVNIILAETGGDTVVSESGTTDTFTVVLDAQPASNISLTVVSGDIGEATVDKATLSFTTANWDVPQIVTVKGVDDQIRDGDQTTTITVAFAASPQTNETISVTTIDDETVRGTNGDDVFRFTELRGGYQVQVNKTSYFLNKSVQRNLAFLGLGGKDLIVITGAGGNETANVRVGTVIVKSSGFDVSGTSMETIRVIGGTGNDRAKLYDSPGNDFLTGRPTFTSLTGKRFDNRVSGFDRVEAFATAGDAGGVGDRAELYDSSGNEKFISRPGFSILSGSGFRNEATGFDQVDGYAKGGDDGGVGDRAYLYDSLGNDLFYGRKTYSYITGKGFTNVAYSFDKVYGIASGDVGGPRDRAFLYDSTGNDTFTARPTKSVLSGRGFYNQVTSFDNVTAFAGKNAGGKGDQANLYDSTGNDKFYGRPTFSYMTGRNFYSRAEGFDLVNAYAKAGSSGRVGDQAYLYDSSGNDVFVGRPDVSSMTGPRYFNQVTSFDRVYAIASKDAGGRGDRADLYDSAGNDTFFGRDSSSYMTGTDFYNRADGFDRVLAHASKDAGGIGDRATVYDSPGNDTFFGRKDFGRLTGKGFLIFAEGFDRINAFAKLGGIDTIDNRDLSYKFIKFGKWERIV